jgi:hypothetical protein
MLQSNKDMNRWRKKIKNNRNERDLRGGHTDSDQKPWHPKEETAPIIGTLLQQLMLQPTTP